MSDWRKDPRWRLHAHDPDVWKASSHTPTPQAERSPDGIFATHYIYNRPAAIWFLDASLIVKPAYEVSTGQTTRAEMSVSTENLARKDVDRSAIRCLS